MIAWALLDGRLVPRNAPWFHLLLTWALVAVALRWPIVVLHRHRIEVSKWSASDDTELGGVKGPRWEMWRVSVPAAEIRDWKREALSIRLLVGGPPSRTVRFSIRGIRPADRERILAWLVEHVGG